MYKALDQLALLPDTPERQRKELEFHSALGGALQATKSYAVPETGRAYAGHVRQAGGDLRLG